MRRDKNYPSDLWLYREKRGNSKKEVARLLGHKNPTHVSEYELGQRLPSLKTALKLAVILSTRVDDLFEEMRKELRQEIQARREKLFAQEDGK